MKLPWSSLGPSFIMVTTNLCRFCLSWEECSGSLTLEGWHSQVCDQIFSCHSDFHSSWDLMLVSHNCGIWCSRSVWDSPTSEHHSGRYYKHLGKNILEAELSHTSVFLGYGRLRWWDLQALCPSEFVVASFFLLGSWNRGTQQAYLLKTSLLYIAEWNNLQEKSQMLFWFLHF